MAVLVERVKVGCLSALLVKNNAMNLPAIEEYIGHSIPVSQYDPNSLISDIPKPYRLKRNPAPQTRNTTMRKTNYRRKN